MLAIIFLIAVISNGALSSIEHPLDREIIVLSKAQIDTTMGSSSSETIATQN